MSRIEANISLLIITFFGAVQYVFLSGVPPTVSDFAFLCVTNFAGFVISLAFFFGELFRLDSRQVLQSVILAAELLGLNVLMLLGASGVSPTVTAAVMSSYFVFVAAFSAVKEKKLPDKGTTAGVLTALTGLFFMTDADINGLMNVNVLYLLLADVVLALYILTTGAYASSSNPSILAMGQMLFCFIFSLILWTGEVVFYGGTFELPTGTIFWGAVIYISFFMRGLYTIIQIYAQRYVSPLNTSLIFSTEIIMTMAVSPLISRLVGTPQENITAMKAAGSVLIILGLLITNSGTRVFLAGLLRPFRNIRVTGLKGLVKRLSSEKLSLKIIAVSALVYAVIDLPVLATEVLPVHAGIKNFLPFTLGLFFGFSGVMGCCLGAVISFSVMGLGTGEILRECAYISLTGIGIWYGWFFFSGGNMISFTRIKNFAVYFVLVLVLSALCFNVWVSGAYFLCGLLIALPVDILFGSLLKIVPVLPGGAKVKDDASFVINSNPESLNSANETIRVSGTKAGAEMKQIFEIQSCIEELSIRILNAIPDADIKVSIIFGNAVSVNMSCTGSKYNPFIIRKGDGVLEVMGLKIIKHRALRASYSYRGGENLIHAVI